MSMSSDDSAEYTASNWLDAELVDDDEAHFDPGLVTEHTYLGRGDGVPGRTVLDEDAVVTLPLVISSSVVLFPGQTLPLSVYDPVVGAMLRRVVEADCTFGFVNISDEASVTSALLKGSVGTTAEIYEVADVTARGGVFVAKAIGRQRFRIVDFRRVHSVSISVVVADVRVLREGDAVEPLRSAGRAAAAVTRWPHWLHQMYSQRHLAALAVRLAARCLTTAQHSDAADASAAADTHLPYEPCRLSYWVAKCLPISDTVRRYLLGMDSVVRRLRCEISIMQQFDHLMCAQCGVRVARMRNVFAMASDGPQNIFVNAHGHLHETLTVYHATHVRCVTAPTSHFSWFTGYSWQIANCRRCHHHMGWRFTLAGGGGGGGGGDRGAVETASGASRAQPLSFWGLRRSSLRTEPLPADARPSPHRNNQHLPAYLVV